MEDTRPGGGRIVHVPQRCGMSVLRTMSVDVQLTNTEGKRVRPLVRRGSAGGVPDAGAARVAAPAMPGMAGANAPPFILPGGHFTAALLFLLFGAAPSSARGDDAFSFEYLENGPETWRVIVARLTDAPEVS